jgi:hypothetical protein
MKMELGPDKSVVPTGIRILNNINANKAVFQGDVKSSSRIRTGQAVVLAEWPNS